MNNILKKFLTVFSLLTVVNILTITVWYPTSIDRGWWPVALLTSSFITLIYTGLVTFLDRLHPLTMRYVVMHSFALGLVLLTETILFYNIFPIDWGAVNDHVKELTFFQASMDNGALIYGMYLIFLVIYLMQVLISRKNEKLNNTI